MDGKTKKILYFIGLLPLNLTALALVFIVVFSAGLELHYGALFRRETAAVDARWLEREAYYAEPLPEEENAAPLYREMFGLISAIPDRREKMEVLTPLIENGFEERKVYYRENREKINGILAEFTPVLELLSQGGGKSCSWGQGGGRRIRTLPHQDRFRYLFTVCWAKSLVCILENDAAAIAPLMEGQTALVISIEPHGSAEGVAMTSWACYVVGLQLENLCIAAEREEFFAGDVRRLFASMDRLVVHTESLPVSALRFERMQLAHFFSQLLKNDLDPFARINYGYLQKRSLIYGVPVLRRPAISFDAWQTFRYQTDRIRIFQQAAPGRPEQTDGFSLTGEEENYWRNYEYITAQKTRLEKLCGAR